MHAAGEDLRICQIRTGKLPRRVFDVQMAAGLVGLSYPLSLSNLVWQVLGVSLGGGETRTDWRRRPLTAGQVQYALDDVRYLLELADVFYRRGWRISGGRRGPRKNSRISSHRLRGGADEERWRRLPGLNQLSRRSLEMARRLAEWREDEARRQNRPLRQLLRDDLLVAIAKRQPTNRRGLEALRDFNRPALLNRSDEILRALEEARSVPEDELPELSSRYDEPPGLSTVVEPALRGADAMLRTAGDRRLSGGERRRCQAPDSLASRGRFRITSSRAAPGVASRTVREVIARCPRRPRGPAGRRSRERVPRGAGAGQETRLGWNPFSVLSVGVNRA